MAFIKTAKPRVVAKYFILLIGALSFIYGAMMYFAASPDYNLVLTWSIIFESIAIIVFLGSSYYSQKWRRFGLNVMALLAFAVLIASFGRLEYFKL